MSSIVAFETNIEAFIREIPAEIFERVSKIWTKRMDNSRRNRGLYFHEKSSEMQIYGPYYQFI